MELCNKIPYHFIVFFLKFGGISFDIFSIKAYFIPGKKKENTKL